MKEEALKRLRDLKLPHDIGIWPLAYGWYIILLLLILSLSALVFWQYRLFLRNRPKKAALRELDAIKADYLKEKNAPRTATELTSLLKRFCFSYYQRKKVAPLYGKELDVFLGNPKWSQSLTAISYQKTSEEDLTPYFNAIAKWIKGKHHV